MSIMGQRQTRIEVKAVKIHIVSDVPVIIFYRLQ